MTPVMVSDIPTTFSTKDNFIEKRRDILKFAMEWLLIQIKLCHNTAVVFDIDDTLLSDGKPIEDTVLFYDYCRKLRVNCFLVTARPYSEKNKHLTMNSLDKIGISDYNYMYMMPDKHKADAYKVAKYKKGARSKIGKDYKIVLNIGDQWTDFFTLPLRREDQYFFSRIQDEAKLMVMNSVDRHIWSYLAIVSTPTDETCLVYKYCAPYLEKGKTYSIYRSNDKWILCQPVIRESKSVSDLVLMYESFANAYDV